MGVEVLLPVQSSVCVCVGGAPREVGWGQGWSCNVKRTVSKGSYSQGELFFGSSDEQVQSRKGGIAKGYRACCLVEFLNINI